MPINVALGILERNGYILMIKRSANYFAGLWGLPGGKVEEGEHFDETVVRELYEETGLEVKFEKLLGVASEIVYEDQKKIHVIIYCCAIKHHKGNYKLRSSDTKWFPICGINQNNQIIPSDLVFLDKFYFRKGETNFLKVLSEKTPKGTYKVEII